MSSFSKYLFPIAAVSAAAFGSVFSASPVHESFSVAYCSADTIIYPKDAYKNRRASASAELALSDSLLKALQSSFDASLPDSANSAVSARDTIKAPDSLKYTDPFRYKYYVALLDSLTHRQVSDSLLGSISARMAALDTLGARLDSAERFKLDSLYAADSAMRARVAFEKWYAGLSRQERKKYDLEQKVKIKMAEADSLKRIKEEEQIVRDSIRESTPRILSTFALPDSLQYKRIVSWKLNPDFQRFEAEVPDTSFNRYFYDYPFLLSDVNASWLGVAGSPLQSYNFFERGGESGLDFYAPYEKWTYGHSTLPHYNTKTPYTELAYWGTMLLADDETESDNLHILTTQNITPELNFQLLYDRWGGGGMLENEDTKNKTFAAGINYLGKKYMAHAGFISNNILHEENGGVADPSMIRDTTVKPREIAVMLGEASNSIKRRTGFIDQQYRIPFNFIKRLGKKGKNPADSLGNAPDSLLSAERPDSLDRNVTSAFIGHSSEWSKYSRLYTDKTTGNPNADKLFGGIYNYSNAGSEDYFEMTHLDNKLFLRLQPWSEDAIVSKLNVGIGDKYRTWQDTSSTGRNTYAENSLYAYAGVEGGLHEYFSWNAGGRLTFAGAEAGDFAVNADARLNFFPFRKARRSPLSLGARFETSLTEPNHYQKSIYANHFSWKNDFAKSSRTIVRAYLDIPHWKLSADVGYALLGNHIHYDTLAVIRQHKPVINVLSASLRKEFVIADFVHLDNRLLLQTCSAQEVLPLPLAAANLKWFIEFVAQRDAAKLHPVLTMQIGLNLWYNTPWYAPAWNPAAGVFHAQNKSLYNNGPVADVFLNMQWKRACIFLKLENANMGWPFDKKDYFSAHNFILTQRTLKLGIFWPFYVQPGDGRGHSHGGGGLSGGNGVSGGGDAFAPDFGAPRGGRAPAGRTPGRR